MEVGSDRPDSSQTAVVLGAQLSLCSHCHLPVESPGIPFPPLPRPTLSKFSSLDTCSCVPLGTKRLTAKNVALSSGPPMAAVGGGLVICVLSRGLCPLDDTFCEASRHTTQARAPPLHAFQLTEWAQTHLKSLAAHERCIP